MKKFENISTKPGFMKHNGGLMFRKINKNIKTIKKNKKTDFCKDIFIIKSFGAPARS